jgi:hypothetical protein
MPPRVAMPDGRPPPSGVTGGEAFAKYLFVLAGVLIGEWLPTSPDALQRRMALPLSIAPDFALLSMANARRFSGVLGGEPGGDSCNLCLGARSLFPVDVRQKLLPVSPWVIKPG